MSESEKSWLRAYVRRDKLLLVTGEDATGLGNAANVIRFSKCPGKDYSAALQKDFDAATPDREHEFLESLKAEACDPRGCFASCSPLRSLELTASLTCFSQTSRGCVGE